MSENIDLVRLSQRALPIAKSFDKDKSGDLDKTEYGLFMAKWAEHFGNESPMLMQLHISALNDEAAEIAQRCDTDDLKGVLTEVELKTFMDEYDKSGLATPFKTGVDVYAVLRGEPHSTLIEDNVKNLTKFGLFNFIKSGYQLFKNLVKRDVMNYKGSDKFFHAVANFEGLQSGSEKSVKSWCSAQDKFKRKSFDRSEADFAEDLYANWLGREFAKLYPDENPQELFEALAPNGFDVEESKKGWIALTSSELQQNELISKLESNSIAYFEESFLAKKLMKCREKFLGMREQAE